MVSSMLCLYVMSYELVVHKPTANTGASAGFLLPPNQQRTTNL